MALEVYTKEQMFEINKEEYDDLKADSRMKELYEDLLAESITYATYRDHHMALNDDFLLRTLSVINPMVFKGLKVIAERKKPTED